MHYDLPVSPPRRVCGEAELLCKGEPFPVSQGVGCQEQAQKDLTPWQGRSFLLEHCGQEAAVGSGCSAITVGASGADRTPRSRQQSPFISHLLQGGFVSVSFSILSSNKLLKACAENVLKPLYFGASTFFSLPSFGGRTQNQLKSLPNKSNPWTLAPPLQAPHSASLTQQRLAPAGSHPSPVG